MSRAFAFIEFAQTTLWTNNFVAASAEHDAFVKLGKNFFNPALTLHALYRNHYGFHKRCAI